MHTHNGTESVSYTHLDVYKRQVLTCPRGSIMFWPIKEITKRTAVQIRR